MPGYDRTGPMGQGPMTGGGFGFCSGARPAGSWAAGRGAGRGARPWGGGRGRVFGGAWQPQGFYDPAYRAGYPDTGPGAPAGSESEFLKAQAEDLRTQLKDLEARLAEIEKE
ncbi:MAG: DUF5320 domain-containing protein [Deltaproteobacteria bacterium]|nr:DUF5320 domain-containing protein [Deltaproteobacteria bacterium]MBW2085934.1 DUF5320 domain-containing protein [Deltaproteobacteria bacterium]